jgi:hypothetical protein
MDHGPKIKEIAFGSAGGMKALKDPFAQMDGEGPLAGLLLAVDRARTAALRACTAQLRQAAELGEDLFHADLFAQSGKIDIPARCRRGWRSGRLGIALVRVGRGR